jgi:hypothetical protein
MYSDVTPHPGSHVARDLAQAPVSSKKRSGAGMCFGWELREYSRLAVGSEMPSVRVL